MQRDVILNNMQSLVNEMYTVVKRISEDENYQLLRFVVCESVICISHSYRMFVTYFRLM